MGPTIDLAETDYTLPARVDVVVIGGGIIGISAALHLARQGNTVLLCEKGKLAGEQSSRNWGWVRKTGRDLREVPLIIEALRMWGEFTREGLPTGFAECGVLYVARSDARVEHQTPRGQQRAPGPAGGAFHMHGAIPAGAHDLRDAAGIVAVGLVRHRAHRRPSGGFANGCFADGSLRVR